MAADNIITLDSWKMAVRIFWKEILKVDMCKSFLCQNCGNLPPTIVFDGIALGCQIKKVKAFQDKMSLVLDRRSKSKLSGTSFFERTYIKSKKNRDLLKHLADKNNGQLPTIQSKSLLQRKTSVWSSSWRWLAAKIGLAPFPTASLFWWKTWPPRPQRQTFSRFCIIF